MNLVSRFYNYNSLTIGKISLKNLSFAKIRLNILPYLVTVILFSLTNLSLYQFLFQNLQEKVDIIIKNATDNIESFPLYEFRTILQHEYITDSLFFFKRFPRLNNRAYQIDSNDKNLNGHINFEDFTVYVIKPKEELMLDPRKLTSFLHNTFPSYVDYQINLNKHTIAQSQNYIGDFTIQKTYKITADDDLGIKLNLNKEESLYKSIIRAIYRKLAISLAISFIFSFIVLYIYLHKQQQINNKIARLSNELTETTEKLTSELDTTSRLLEIRATDAEKQKNAVFLEQKSERSLRKLFIRNATAIYLDNNIPNMSPEQKRVNELSNFLFPIAFTEPANDEEIKVHEVIKDLTDYTAFEAIKYDIKFDKKVDIIKVQCSKTVFYQILFSLVSNLIHLMPAVSDNPALNETKKKFTVTFLAEKIIIDYETFPLSADNIGGFLHKKGTDVVDAFFLDYRRILESLKNHKIDHTISAAKTGNRFELDFKKKIPKGKPNLRLVE